MSIVMPSLKEICASSFKIGAAVSNRVLQDKASFIQQQFSSLTAENSMKFESVQPMEGVFDFQEGDEIVSFAKANQMEVRGHTLVWHNQTPNWVFYKDKEQKEIASKELVLSRMQRHIEEVVTRYKDTISCWDVVNEVMDDKGGSFFRPSKWRDIVGDSFIEEAFRMTHQANPTATLFYNDYNESAPVKSEKMNTMIQSLLDREVPIHGVGLQCHWNIFDPELDHIKRAFEKYAKLGLRIHVTELDVSLYAFENKKTEFLLPDERILELQAERYESFFKIFKEYDSVLDSVTFWGVDDAYTWLDDFPVHGRKNWPFLFDENSQPKPAFWRVANVMKENAGK